MSRIDISSAGESGCISASIARAPPHDLRVGSSLHASDGAHGVLPCPRPTMLGLPMPHVNPPGGALRLEVQSAHKADTSSLSGALEFWADPTRLAKGVPLHRLLPTITLMRDTSEEGWADVCGHHTIRGVWAGEQTRLHISYLELMAVFLALMRFQSMLCGQHVLVQTDNTTVMYYLNKGEGTRSRSLTSWLVI